MYRNIISYTNEDDILNSPNKSDYRKNIYSLGELEKKCVSLKARIGIITVPPQYAQKICDRLVAAGIKAIWNFASVQLNVPEGVIVQNENMASSLAVLSNKLKEMSK